MQWKFVHPLKQPWSGQSKTGSMQIFVVQELGPPSSDELLVLPSGRVKGGNVNGGAPPPSSPPLLDGEPSSPVVASSEGTLESSEEAAPPPLLLLPPLPPLLDPEQFVHESSPVA